MKSLFKFGKVLLILAIGCLGFSEPPPVAPQVASKTLHFSECTQQPCSKEESIQYVYDLDKLTITHNNAWLECGIRGTTLSFKEQQPGIFKISENEIRESSTAANGTTSFIVTFCYCYFTIVYEIPNIKSGHYDFEIKHPTSDAPTSLSIVIDDSRPSSGLIKVRSVPVVLSRVLRKNK